MYKGLDINISDNNSEIIISISDLSYYLSDYLLLIGFYKDFSVKTSLNMIKEKISSKKGGVIKEINKIISNNTNLDPLKVSFKVIQRQLSAILLLTEYENNTMEINQAKILLDDLVKKIKFLETRN